MYFIDVTESSGKYEMDVVVNEAEVTWNLVFSSNPPLTVLALFDNHDNEIPGSIHANPNGKIGMLRIGCNLTITIRNVKTNDAGEYSLHAKNSKTSTERKLKLRVRGDFQEIFIHHHRSAD